MLGSPDHGEQCNVTKEYSVGITADVCIIAARVLLTEIAQTSIKTREKGIRANDGSFAALLLIEGLDETAVRDALHHLRKTLPAEDHGAIDDLPLYRLAFSLPKRLLQG